MRFLNTSTLKFEEVADSSLGTDECRYAILSHRWLPNADDEVLFADIRGDHDISSKKGFEKLKGFCGLSEALGYRYAWDDTCCINKENSSELNEAINSMYRWYQQSDVCIAYLEDVPDVPFIDSVWFDRGWTLQELIAPRALQFYNRAWHEIGTKLERLPEISARTNIPQGILDHSAKPSAFSVAARFSWAASRVTTRVEDRAYSLLGILGVSIPSIYGEREQAFIRLQKAIVQQSKDESIFAWSMGSDGDSRSCTGLFAPSPSAYVGCGDVIPTSESSGFSEVNGELSITLFTFPYSIDTYGAFLACTEKSFPGSRRVIFVSKLGAGNEYARVNKGFLGGITRKTLAYGTNVVRRPIRVPSDPAEPRNVFYGFWLRTLSPPGREDCRTTIISAHSQPEQDTICIRDESWGTAGLIGFVPVKEMGSRSWQSSGWSQIRWVRLGFDRDFNPMLCFENGKTEVCTPLPKGGKLVHSEHITATESSITPSDRIKILDNSWIDSEGSVPDETHGWPTGASILKVNKALGISGVITALNLGISVRLSPMYSPTEPTGENSQSSPRSIWVVDITVNRKSDPETYKSAHSKESCGLGCCLLLGGCFIPFLNSAVQKTITERQNEQTQSSLRRKVLTDVDLIRSKDIWM